MTKVENGQDRKNPPYVPFSEKAKLITIEGYSVYPYVSPEEMVKYIIALSETVKLKDYSAVLINNDGGQFLFQALSKLQGYDSKPIEIEYHPTYDENLIRVDKAVPNDLKNKDLLVVEDVYDRGITLEEILADAPKATIVVAVKKRVPDQIVIPGVYVGIEVDEYWLGGVGMNFGKGYPDSYPRNYPGIVVKPEPLSTVL